MSSTNSSSSFNGTTPGYDAAEATHIFLSVGVPFLVLWMFVTPALLLALTKCCRHTLRNDRKYFKNHPFVWFLGFVWLFVEFGQVNWFSFIQNVPWPGQQFTLFLNVFLLNFNLPWVAWFWIYVGYAIFILAVVFSVVCCCDGGDLGVVAAMVVLTMIPVFQPVMYRMIQALTCTYPIGEPPYLDAIEREGGTMICWEGIHILYVTFSCLVITIFYPLIAIIMSLLVAGKTEASIWIVFGVMQFKMIEVVIATLFYTYVLGVLLALLGVNITFILLSLGMPSESNVINLIRSIVMAMAAWATICILIQFGVNDPSNWVGVILLVIGWVVIPLVFVIFLRKYYYPADPKAPSKMPSEMPPIPQKDPENPTTLSSDSGPGAEIHIHQVQYLPVPVGTAVASPASPPSRPVSTHDGVPSVNGMPVGMAIQPAYPVT